MARERVTGTGRHRESPAQDAGATGAVGGDTFSGAGAVPPVIGGPEIDATDEAMGGHMVHLMNQVNGEDGGQYDLDHGVKYSYNRQRECNEAGRPDLWKDEYRLGHNYGDHFINPSESGAFMHFVLKKGHSASEAIKAWLGGPTVAECNTSVMAMEYDTVRAAIGDDKFDQYFGSKDPVVDKAIPAEHRLLIKKDPDGTPLAELMKDPDLKAAADKKGGKLSEEDKEKLLKPGEWYYFRNHPRYLLKHPGGAWQGENSLYMGKNAGGERVWAGMGASDKTEATMMEEMVEAYNLPRDADDQRAIREDGLEHDSQFTPGNGSFPDQITEADILSASAYTLWGQTRIGGFRVDSEHGHTLDAAKIGQLRKG